MERDFYVYALFTPWDGQPCYVGKGRGRRWNAHKQLGVRHHNTRLAALYGKAKTLGAEIRRLKIRVDLSEHEAVTVEAALIALVGRIDLGTGPLTNVTAGGGGLSGKIWTEAERLKKSDGMKKRWADPVWRVKQTKIFQQVAARRPRTVKPKKIVPAGVRSLRAKRVWQNPAARKKLMDFNTSAKTRALRSRQALARWADPAFKVKASAAMRGKKNLRKRKKKVAT